MAYSDKRISIVFMVASQRSGCALVTCFHDQQAAAAVAVAAAEAVAHGPRNLHSFMLLSVVNIALGEKSVVVLCMHCSQSMHAEQRNTSH